MKAILELDEVEFLTQDLAPFLPKDIKPKSVGNSLKAAQKILEEYGLVPFVNHSRRELIRSKRRGAIWKFKKELIPKEISKALSA